MKDKALRSAEELCMIDILDDSLPWEVECERWKALEYINNGQRIPDELYKKLLKYREDDIKKYRPDYETTVRISLWGEGALKFYAGVYVMYAEVPKKLKVIERVSGFESELGLMELDTNIGKHLVCLSEQLELYHSGLHPIDDGFYPDSQEDLQKILKNIKNFKLDANNIILGVVI